jgi:hypothetical protein
VEVVYVGGVEVAPGQNVVVIAIVSVVILPRGQLVTTGGQEVMVKTEVVVYVMVMFDDWVRVGTEELDQLPADVSRVGVWDTDEDSEAVGEVVGTVDKVVTGVEEAEDIGGHVEYGGSLVIPLCAPERRGMPFDPLGISTTWLAGASKLDCAIAISLFWRS